MHLGTDEQGRHVGIPAADLTTHGVVLGRTGSGKTGLVSVLVEEAATSGATVLVFDPKGDLGSLALRPTEDSELRSWGGDPAAHWQGLARAGYGHNHALFWRERVHVDVFTPGGPRPINVFPTFEVPSVPSQESAARDVGVMLHAIRGPSRADDVTDIGMTKAVLAHWARGVRFPVTAWPNYLSDQSFSGAFYEDHWPRRARMSLARTVMRFLHESGRWIAGPSLALGDLGYRVVVLSLRHLDEEQRQTFTAAALTRVVDFMGESSGGQGLRLLVVLDEARGYLPPHPANPPCKKVLSTLLAQGRASGVGVLLGTQNPMDLDYKALSNVGTWCVGRLRERDCARDLLSELRDRDVSASDIESAQPREFLLIGQTGRKRRFTTRWALSYLRGPMTLNEIADLP